MADSMIRISRGAQGDLNLRASQVSHTEWQRGHSYESLIITMMNGERFQIRDWNGSAYKVEEQVLKAVDAYFKDL